MSLEWVYIVDIPPISMGLFEKHGMAAPVWVAEMAIDMMEIGKQN